MNILRIYSIGADAILTKNCSTKGIVTKVHQSWVKVNRKPIRLSASDGAVFAHYITFEYTVGHIPYQGTLFVGRCCRCPQVGEQIDIYYDPQKPRSYACCAFGPVIT